MLRFLTAGESHGPALTAIVEGLPAGLSVTEDDFAGELARRRHGFGRGRRMALEQDKVEILGGVRHGKTLGSPVAVLVHNTEWAKWEDEMSPAPGKARREVTRPRPGHADLAGMIKYHTGDARDVLERASARETAARTVVGTLAKRLLHAAGVTITSHVVSIGGVASDGRRPGPDDAAGVDASPVRCLDPAASDRMVAAIERAKEERDTLGGRFEVLAFGVPVGVGSHVHHDRRLDAQLAAAVMSIPAVKSVAIGEGWVTPDLPGSRSHDEILLGTEGLTRSTNRAGGIEGGISNGEVIVVAAGMKPLSTLMRPLRTVDVATGEQAEAVRERSDVCSVPAAAVVGEHVVAIVLAREFQRKFGGDTLDEFTRSVSFHRERIRGLPGE